MKKSKREKLRNRPKQEKKALSNDQWIFYTAYLITKHEKLQSYH